MSDKKFVIPTVIVALTARSIAWTERHDCDYLMPCVLGE